MSDYKICLVPTCPNTRINSPNKTFVYVSDNLKSRWCTEYNFKYIPRHSFCCEDHLDLKEALTNYRTWRLMHAKPILKSTANLLLKKKKSDKLPAVWSETCIDPHRMIYIKKCDSIPNVKPLIEIPRPVKLENTANVCLQCKVQTVTRSTYKEQKAPCIKPPRASPTRRERQLVEDPDSSVSTSPKSNQTFTISPLQSNNAISVHIQCKAETEDCGTTSKHIYDPSNRTLVPENNADASLQCSLITADDNLIKPRKTRFSQSGIKRYDLVQDKRIKSSLITNRPVQTEQSSLLTRENLSTSGTQRSRSSRPSVEIDLSEDQNDIAVRPLIIESPRMSKNNASLSFQSRSRLRHSEIYPKLTPIQTRQPMASRIENVLRQSFRNTIVCEKQRHRISGSSLSQDPGKQSRSSKKNTAQASLQVSSRKSLVRSPVMSRVKGVVLSPTRLDRNKVGSRGSISKRIVIRIPKSSNHSVNNIT